MSGVAGIIHVDDRPVAPGGVEGMTAAMRYRGPDGIRHWRRGPVALGHCMLCTTRESLQEVQPLTSRDESLVLVMDGRVDNWRELRRDLLARGAGLQTRGDAELVLRAYELWAEECVVRIEGDFAFLIWDARRRQAFAARDRAGNKPFNYQWNGRTLAFASDLQAILPLPWVPRVLNTDMVAEYLAADWRSLSETLWQDVLRLPPAHCLTAGGSGLRLRRYWTPDVHAVLPCRNDAEYIEHHRGLFSDVVGRLSRSHRPLACEVSGGLDSSAIFAVAETLRRQGRLPAPALEGYTFDFRGDQAADELAFARAVGTHLGRTIHEVAPASKPLDWYRQQAARCGEFPGYPNGTMHLTILSRAAAGGSRVVLNGIGGDEWTGGCRYSYAEAMAGRRGRELMDILGADGKDSGWSLACWWLMRFGVAPLLPAWFRRAGRSLASALGSSWTSDRPWLAPALRERLRHRPPVSPGNGPVARHGQRRQFALLNDSYNTLAREMNERQAAEMGLECRQPFWDAGIVQAAFATPEHWRLRGSQNKWLHRQAMAGLLPERVVRRRDKAEFTVTFARHWRELGMALEQSVLQRRGDWVNASCMRDLLRQGLPPDRAGWPEGVLWTLLGVDAVAAGVPATALRSAVE
jgi:asparagine synthase (glutamine-hydrolysing)